MSIFDLQSFARREIDDTVNNNLLPSKIYYIERYYKIYLGVEGSKSMFSIPCKILSNNKSLGIRFNNLYINIFYRKTYIIIDIL